jgi:hypothetical protein
MVVFLKKKEDEERTVLLLTQGIGGKFVVTTNWILFRGGLVDYGRLEWESAQLKVDEKLAAVWYRNGVLAEMIRQRPRWKLMGPDNGFDVHWTCCGSSGLAWLRSCGVWPPEARLPLAWLLNLVLRWLLSLLFALVPCCVSFFPVFFPGPCGRVVSPCSGWQRLGVGLYLCLSLQWKFLPFVSIFYKKNLKKFIKKNPIQSEGYFLWRQSSFHSKWEWFPSEIHIR